MSKAGKGSKGSPSKASPAKASPTKEKATKGKAASGGVTKKKLAQPQKASVHTMRTRTAKGSDATELKKIVAAAETAKGSKKRLSQLEKAAAEGARFVTHVPENSSVHLKGKKSK